MKSRLFSASYKTLFLTLTLSIVIAMCAAPALSQDNAASQPPSRIAVIDIKRLLDDHHRFKASMEGLKVEFEKAGQSLNTERLRIIEMERRLKELNPNTPDYNRLEEQIQRAKTEWTLKANKHKKDLRNREAQILWNVYYEIKAETKRFCEYNGIGLVIQFNGEKIEGTQPQDVVRGISRPIVYNAPELDITTFIQQALNRSGNVSRRPETTQDNRQGVIGRPQ